MMKNQLINIGKKSKKSFSNKLDTRKKNQVLKDYCKLIEKNKKLIIKENEKDIKNAYRKKLKNNLIERLVLNDKKILNLIKSVKNVIKLKHIVVCNFDC